ncbi:Aspartate-semialdehyde dehydrogenase [Rickettsiales endosymbiont of Paramecium tredecaurelia]|uniref:aspartate-semialdehyde dehydrogenase n=1 Tax=Candidatus Sarmatiella mevalonica TaxID=2770581 RepID=UPI0019205690|nr:aspartate-semialdehyde dehydrogenase [Candidatus Sarmatiella mevalonica]MBL3284769.1 Aspartate-semialdehyde dehydrogenase [Candidatus Sarmatiella mevalonica]
MKIAVIGATGATGLETLNIIYEQNLPFKILHAFASRGPENREIELRNKQRMKVLDISDINFHEYELVFFCTPASISQYYVPIALNAGCKVIDKSDFFRMSPSATLVVPEVNGDLIRNANLICTPNCTAIPVILTLKPLAQIAQITKIVIATYQSVSGAGKSGVDELRNQTKEICEGASTCKILNQANIFPKQIAFNLFPQIGEMCDDGDYAEEQKIKQEIKKIMNIPSLELSVTAVRVPVFTSHSICLHVQFDNSSNITKDKIEELLSNSKGIMYSAEYKTPVEVSGTDYAFVSRLRVNAENSLDLWIVCDNIRKGAALNAVQIALCALDEQCM